MTRAAMTVQVVEIARDASGITFAMGDRNGRRFKLTREALVRELVQEALSVGLEVGVDEAEQAVDRLLASRGAA